MQRIIRCSAVMMRMRIEQPKRLRLGLRMDGTGLERRKQVDDMASDTSVTGVGDGIDGNEKMRAQKETVQPTKCKLRDRILYCMHE